MDVSAVSSAPAAGVPLAPTDPTDFAARLAATTGSTPGSIVDDGPGGSGAVLQLDGNGRIICECPECSGPSQLRSAPVNSSSSSPSTSPVSSGSVRLPDAAVRRALAEMFRLAEVPAFE